MYGCSGWNRLWCFSVQIASSRTNMLTHSITDAWLKHVNPTMAAHIAASTGLGSKSLLGSGLAAGFLIHTIKSTRSMPTKYGSHCVCSTHGLTLSDYGVLMGL
jgi:hypothetical protein